MFGALSEKEYSISRSFTLVGVLESDLIHFQKTLLPKLLFFHFVSKLFLKKTVYDIDDQPHNIFVALLMICNVLMANVLTVDTKERKRYWQRIFFWKRVVVIPDVLDVADLEMGESFCRRTVRLQKIDLVWIGHPLNIVSITKLLESDSVGKLFNLTVITAKDSIEGLSKKYSNIIFLPWSKDILFQRNRQFDCMVLNHFGGEVSAMKSDNKMALAVNAGIVPIVSNTPSYSRLAKKLGYDKFVFDRIENIPEILASANASDFNRLLSARAIVQSMYGPAVVAKEFVSKIVAK